jgi:hypothetical protein
MAIRQNGSQTLSALSPSGAIQNNWRVEATVKAHKICLMVAQQNLVKGGGAGVWQWKGSRVSSGECLLLGPSAHACGVRQSQGLAIADLMSTCARISM